MAPRRLVLIDGHSNVFKAYHAIKQSLTNTQGEPTSAVYGFISMFMRLHRDMEFPHVVVVFDPPGGTFRDAMFAEYKANRPPMPDDLRIQEKRIRQWLQVMGVPVMELPGFEADDVLGALAIRAVEAGGEALICSADKDLLQLVRPGISIWREHLQKTELLDEQGVVEKLGIRPDQVAEYLGLVGDSADNIPGVAGIGKKTAAQLLSDHGSIDGILAAIPKMMKVSKALQNLMENQEAARLSTRLATLDTDCVKEFGWDDFAWQYRPNEELRQFYREMEFRTLLEELPGKTVEERTTDYAILRTRAQLEEAVAAIRQAGRAAIDTETDDLDPRMARLVGISLSWRRNQGVYIPLANDCGGECASMADVRGVLGPALADESITWIAHNWGFDYAILKFADLTPARLGGDTMLAAYLVNPERPGTLKLKELALTHLGIQMTLISELLGDSNDMLTMAGVSVEETARYACQDADVTLQLHETLVASLAEAEMIPLYEKIEVPLVRVLTEMELMGVRIDRDYFRELSTVAEKQLGILTAEAHAIVGRPFNVNSPRQLAEILFVELNLPSGKKGKSGVFSTDVSVLESLEVLHPLPAKMLELRSVEKLKSTYIDPLPGMVHPRTGRVHTSYNQTVAATGRLSSSNPNLQNIPVRTEAGRAIRRGFVPREAGWKLLAADYSQIELRILAHLSGDAALGEAFRSGGDVHTLTASRMFKLAPEDVTSTQRTQAKAINFGIIYGMSEFRLGRDLGISNAEAKHFIQEYFRVYAGVKAFIDGTIAQAKRDRYVTTLCGRRRFVSDINSGNYNSRSAAERIAVNTPIQGTNADMIKLAMLRVADRLARQGMESRMILQVHDELIFDAPETELAALETLVVEEMSQAIELTVPIKVEVAIGDNWAEC